MTDKEELRRLAQAATKGNWYLSCGHYIYSDITVNDGDEEWRPVIAMTDDDESQVNYESNAAFIAAANPAAILDLLDEIELIQTELMEQSRLLGMSAERELALQAQIQRLISERNAFGLAIDRAILGIVPEKHPLRSRLVEIAALKARLVEMLQQPLTSVPAPIEGAKYMSKEWHYAEGWNDCRAAMLYAQENNDE